jgi:hypothetical protein
MRKKNADDEEPQIRASLVIFTSRLLTHAYAKEYR